MSSTSQHSLDPRSPPQFFAYSAMPFDASDDDSPLSSPPSPDPATAGASALTDVQNLVLEAIRRLEGLESAISCNEQRIAVLEESLAIYNEDVSQAQKKMRASAVDINVHQNTVSSLESHIGQLEEKIETLHESVSKGSEKQTNSLRETEHRLLTVLENYKATQSQATHDKFTLLHKDFDMVKSLQGDLKGDIHQLCDKFGTADKLIEELTGQSTTVSELVSQVLCLQSQHSSLSQDMDGLREQINDVTSGNCHFTLEEELSRFPCTPALVTDTENRDSGDVSFLETGLSNLRICDNPSTDNTPALVAAENDLPQGGRFMNTTMKQLSAASRDDSSVGICVDTTGSLRELSIRDSKGRTREHNFKRRLIKTQRSSPFNFEFLFADIMHALGLRIAMVEFFTWVQRGTEFLSSGTSIFIAVIILLQCFPLVKSGSYTRASQHTEEGFYIR
ncbi:hypothetical protein CONPUDRAFT_149667 [Coniophora puteana RWD-64-598 SS2]|uniref:Uncharacterized protein n=1 Tax=Coniophora puteana (strain RWD-64-598) TaxID=741705 RepID=A0A5M3N0J2_CONPW|nr:uncharacterized protein CONPUDRAFT_149667 [Coniophora puteana RWD-64-598 SS2]EIW84796.1 hypothetical protein CONPUDRAFT_149667 [Coniophora puteana RWD-64-598 SS2]